MINNIYAKFVLWLIRPALIEERKRRNEIKKSIAKIPKLNPDEVITIMVFRPRLLTRLKMFLRLGKPSHQDYVDGLL